MASSKLRDYIEDILLTMGEINGIKRDTLWKSVSN